MKRYFFRDGLRAGRAPVWFWLPALLLSAGSLAGAGWALRSHDNTSVPQDSRGEAYPAERPGPVVCLGVGDFEGGVLSLHPTVPGRAASVPVAENEVVRAGTVLL